MRGFLIILITPYIRLIFSRETDSADPSKFVLLKVKSVTGPPASTGTPKVQLSLLSQFSKIYQWNV